MITKKAGLNTDFQISGTGATRNQINFKCSKGVDLRESTVHGWVVQKLVNVNIRLDVNQSIKIIFYFSYLQFL